MAVSSGANRTDRPDRALRIPQLALKLAVDPDAGLYEVRREVALQLGEVVGDVVVRPNHQVLAQSEVIRTITLNESP